MKPVVIIITMYVYRKTCMQISMTTLFVIDKNKVIQMFKTADSTKYIIFIYPKNGILLSNKKNQTSDTHNNMNES